MHSLSQCDRSVNRSPVRLSVLVAENNKLHNTAASADPTSAALAAANARLQALRARVQGQKATVARETSAEKVAPGQPFNAADALPPHLGWGNDRLRQFAKTQKQPQAPQNLEQIAPNTPTETSETPSADLTSTLTVAPDLLIAFLRQEIASIGRIWLLCRHLDDAGRGWLPISELRAQLTRKASPLRVCGWRRLRQLLAAGKDLLWQRDDQGRLWLAGTARVANRLGIGRFEHNPIALPLSALVAPLATTKAHFYASLHSARAAKQVRRTPNSNNNALSRPISRKTLHQLTDLSARSQRRYDRLLAIHKQRNMAIAGSYSAEAHAQAIWDGHATFKFIDKRGQQGSAGAAYVAWHLPNQYGGIHTTTLSQRRKRLNRALKQFSTHSVTNNRTDSFDLADYGEQGNARGNQYDRRFFTDAAELQARRPVITGEQYWPASHSGVWWVQQHEI